MNAFFFWLFSGGMIVCALAVVLNRNAVASALCFTFAIIFMSGLFVMLSAFFLAAVQIIVTAGAVMVLFLFIIMLLDLTAMEHMPRQKIWMGCTLVLALGFLVLVAKTLASTPPELNTANTYRTKGEAIEATSIARMENGTSNTDFRLSQSKWERQDDTHQIGRLLFATSTADGQTSYVAPFEITSLLILVATVGVIVLCKQDERPRPGAREQIIREAPPIESKEAAALGGN
jgi:NADH-quinone oxidoreductase subunit J